MASTTNNWELFGYDVRAIGQHWSAAWRDFLYADSSPIRRHLDEVVELTTESGTQRLQAGNPSHAVGSVECLAVQLPDDLVLHRKLTLPLQVESELDSVVALEVSSRSPFSSEDSRYGWTVTARGADTLTVDIAIVSAVTVQRFLSQHEAPDDAEVWAQTDGAHIVLRGYGEARRDTLYRKRLIRVGAFIGGIFVLLLALVATLAAFRALEANRMEALLASYEVRARDAVAARDRLRAAEATLIAARSARAKQGNPHAVLALLTEGLDDASYLEQLTIRGRDVKLRGRSGNAASVMEGLTKESRFARVTSPQAIRRIGATGEELYYLDIRVAEQADD